MGVDSFESMENSISSLLTLGAGCGILCLLRLGFESPEFLLDFIASFASHVLARKWVREEQQAMALSVAWVRAKECLDGQEDGRLDCDRMPLS